MADAISQADEIREQMARIRSNLHLDMREVVDSASAATNWRSYLTRYPWVTLGAAFAAGYLVVPRRARPLPIAVAPLESLVSPERVERAVAAVAPPKKKGGLFKSLFWMVAPIATRAAQSYAISLIEGALANPAQGATQADFGARAAPPPYPQPPGRPRPTY